MRVLALPVVLVAGCLSAPTGRDPGTIDAATDALGAAWPPPSASIMALGAGDLDGDGKDDVIAVDQTSARVFVLRGGTDIDPTRAAVTTVGQSAPLAGARPPAAVIVARNGADRFVVVVDNPPAGPRLTVFDHELTMVSQTMAGSVPAPAASVVTLTQTTFGMNMNAIFASLPDQIFFIEGTSLPMTSANVMPLPETGTPLASVLAVAGFVVAGTPATPTVLVSELDHAQKAIPSGPGVFNWSTVRTTGATWISQAVADVTGDTYSDIVGFAPDGTNPAKICVLDGASGNTPACYDTAFNMDTGVIAVGPVVAAAQNDVIVAHVNPGAPTMTALFVVSRVRVAGTVMADGFSAPAMFPIENPLLTLAQLDAAGDEIILMGRNGAVVCARSNGSAPVACAP